MIEKQAQVSCIERILNYIRVSGLVTGREMWLCIIKIKCTVFDGIKGHHHYSISVFHASMDQTVWLELASQKTALVFFFLLSVFVWVLMTVCPWCQLPECFLHSASIVVCSGMFTHKYIRCTPISAVHIYENNVFNALKHVNKLNFMHRI